MPVKPHEQKSPIPPPAAIDRLALLTHEYQDFVYIVSHDFGAPLRHIKQFTKLIVDAHKGDMDQDERYYVEFLDKSLQKLEKMQDALLAISRLNTQDQTLIETDCNEAVKKALIDLKDDINRQQVSIECKSLPTLMANPRQMQILFFQLISNAIKFHEPTQTDKQVLISAIDREDSWLFQISDNGIGIAPEHREDVFRLFRQIYPEKYSGLGVGLTMAKKIAQRHKGEIIIESTPHKGTSVFFSVPKNLQWP